jgi:serine protease
MKPRFSALLSLLLLAALVLAVSESRGAGQAAGHSPELVEWGQVAGPASGVIEGVILVRFRQDAPPAAVQALNNALGAQILKAQPLSGIQRLQLPPTANVDQVLPAYRANPLVLEAGLSRTVTLFEAPNDTNYAYQWHLHNTNGGMWAEAAWDIAPNRGAGVTVAVIDTGVAFEGYTRTSGVPFGPWNFAPAPDLAGTNFVAPWNFVHDDAHANDDHGHGTHVTGTIRQTTNNGYGVAGVAHQSNIMPIKVLDWSGSGQDDDLMEAIYYAVANGADVINMSLGFPNSGLPDPEGNVCTEIVGLNAALEFAYASGVVLVGASGNSGGVVSCPAAHPAVIAVGATRFDAQVTSYSNRGPGLHLVAPGGDPNVDQNRDGFSDGVVQETYCWPGSFIILLGGNFNSFCNVFMSGTSMATPHVAGTVALLLGEDGSLTPGEVADILALTARDLGPAGWDELYGWGLLDARAAIEALAALTTPTPTPTQTPTPTPTATPTPAHTSTPTPIATSTPTPVATQTPTPAPADEVTITKVEYNPRKGELTVEAKSTRADVQLFAYDATDVDNPVLLGELRYIRGRRVFSAKFSGLEAAPTRVLVVSTGGGSAIQ